jgi:NRAMP (natural resistance-associated macrophage protein)-like metal ion transporter
LAVAARKRAAARRRTGRTRPGWLRFFAVLGPGLIAANAGNDAGAGATYSSVGASYGYDLLWMMALITVSLAVVQEMCARMGAVTGKGLADLIREQFGVRWSTFAMLTLLLANGGTVISEFAGIAAGLELFGISRFIAVPVSAVVLWWLVLRGGYARVERVFVLMGTVFFAYIIVAITARPDWGATARGPLIPSFHLESGYILLFVATVGTTITPYMQLFVQSSTPYM